MISKRTAGFFYFISITDKVIFNNTYKYPIVHDIPIVYRRLILLNKEKVKWHNLCSILEFLIYFYRQKIDTLKVAHFVFSVDTILSKWSVLYRGPVLVHHQPNKKFMAFLSVKFFFTVVLHSRHDVILYCA